VRYLVLIIGLLGVAGAAGIGLLGLKARGEEKPNREREIAAAKLLGQLVPQATIDLLNKELARDAMKDGMIYLYLASAGIGFFGALFGFLRRGFSGALVLLSAAAGPPILFFKTVPSSAETGAYVVFLAAPGAFALAGLFSLLVGPARPKRARTDEDEEADEDRDE
jgi:hypothetical protein